MLVRSGRSQEAVDNLDIVYSEARYSFTELSAWRDRAFPALALRDDWTALDIDEEHNILRIGVSDASGIADMRVQIASAQVPVEAFEIVVEPFVELTQVKGLADRWRPLIGGTQTGPSQCTLGITARINGEAVILTAAHCSATYGSVDGGPVAQPAGFPLFGEEIRDQSFSCGFLGLSTCRHADVAAYTITGIDLNTGEIPLRIGTIAKPTTRVWGGTNTPGSLVVDLSDPYLEIHFGTTAAVGEVVEKIGITTGWTYGYVRYTCVDRKQRNGPLIYCQDIADINQEPGDSGAPVFIRDAAGNAVILVGIAWGRVGGQGSAGTDGIYGNINQLTQALGGPFDFALEPF